MTDTLDLIYLVGLFKLHLSVHFHADKCLYWVFPFDIQLLSGSIINKSNRAIFAFLFCNDTFIGAIFIYNKLTFDFPNGFKLVVKHKDWLWYLGIAIVGL